MKAQNNLVRNVIGVACVLLVLLSCSGSAQSSNPHFKRGMDWMELQKYSDAIQEFQLTIQQEPKNAEARYLIARSYDLSGDPLAALTWIEETVSVAPGHVGARSLRLTVGKKAANYLMSGDRRTILLGLAIAERVPTTDAAAPLGTLMASTDQNIASTAEALLLKIDSKRVRSVWISWLDSRDTRIKELGAAKLWDSERYGPAAPILREKYHRLLVTGIWERGESAGSIASKLLELGVPGVSDIFAAVIREKPETVPAIVSAKLLAQTGDQRIGPLLIEAFSKRFLNKNDRWAFCSSPYTEFADILAQTKGTDSAQILKEVLSDQLFQRGGIRLECIDSYLAALARVEDNSEWKGFKYWSNGGHLYFGEVVGDLQDSSGPYPQPRNNPIAKGSPNTDKILRWIETVKSADLRHAFIKVISPRLIEYYVEASYRRQPIKTTYVLSLMADKDARRFWVVTDVRQVD